MGNTSTPEASAEVPKQSLNAEPKIAVNDDNYSVENQSSAKHNKSKPKHSSNRKSGVWIGNTLPGWWNPNEKKKLFVKIDATTNFKIKNAIASLKSTVPNITILEIYSIQSEEIWRMHQSLEYNWTKYRFQDNRLLNIKWLWHGSSRDVIEHICAKGFLRDFSTTHKYGKGVYFAVNASYSIDPTYAEPEPNGDQYLLYCRVICGESVAGDGSYIRPPQKKQAMVEYETMVDNTQNPSIVVTANDAQAYPCFLFRLKTN